MATLKEQRKPSWNNSLGTCPTCFSRIFRYALLSGLHNWSIEERCKCRKINNVAEWPFQEEPTLMAVKPDEFIEHAVFMNVERAKYGPEWEELMQELYGDLYDEEEARYNDDVDHGWENDALGRMP